MMTEPTKPLLPEKPTEVEIKYHFMMGKLHMLYFASPSNQRQIALTEKSLLHAPAKVLPHTS